MTRTADNPRLPITPIESGRAGPSKAADMAYRPLVGNVPQARSDRRLHRRLTAEAQRSGHPGEGGGTTRSIMRCSARTSSWKGAVTWPANASSMARLEARNDVGQGWPWALSRLSQVTAVGAEAVAGISEHGCGCYRRAGRAPRTVLGFPGCFWFVGGLGGQTTLVGIRAYPGLLLGSGWGVGLCGDQGADVPGEAI